MLSLIHTVITLRDLRFTLIVIGAVDTMVDTKILNQDGRSS